MSVTQNSQLYKKPTFNQALIDQFTPMIHMMIRKNVIGYNSSDVCYEWEDMFQECLMHLNEAVEKFDDSKGMKFSNFAYMVFNSRLGNFRNKISKNNFKTSNFSSIAGGWGITGSEVDDKTETVVSSKYEEGIELDVQMINHQILDAKLVYERLSGDRKKIYQDFFIMGKTVSEIVKENEHLKGHNVRNHLKHLEKIHSTLVEGQLVQ